jgi:hypothetical protein
MVETLRSAEERARRPTIAASIMGLIAIFIPPLSFSTYRRGQRFIRLRAALLRLTAVGDNRTMQDEPPKAALPMRKRRWFQFSLRSLLIVVALLAVVCGDVGRQAEIMREPTRFVGRLITTD